MVCSICNGKLSPTGKCKRCYDRKYQPIWKKKNPDKAIWYHRKSAYGLTEATFNKLFDSQDRRCKICLSLSPGENRQWNIDHDHQTGEIRGIICHSCNVILGHSYDNIITLLRAVDYLTEPGTGLYIRNVRINFKSERKAEKKKITANPYE